MKTAYVIAAAGLIVVTLVAAVAFYLSMPSGSETILIGYTGPLSPPGDYSGGTEQRVAAEIAVEEINAAGGVLGKNLTLLIADDRGIPEKGASAVEKLIALDKIVALTGGYHSSVALAVMEVTERYGIPWVVASASVDEITQKGYNSVFRIGSYTSVYGETMGNFLLYLKQQGVIKSMAVLYEDTDYGISEWGFIKKIVNATIPYSEDVYDWESKDFTALLAKYKEKSPRPEALVVVGTGSAMYLLIKQAKEIGFAPTPETPVIIDSTGMMGYPEYWSVTQEAGNYVFGKVEITPQLKLTSSGQAFREKFKAVVGKDPVPYAYEEYDCVYTIAKAIENAGSTEPNAIIEQLKKTDFVGTQFRIKFEFNKGTVMWQQVPRTNYIIQVQELNQPFEEMPIVYPLADATGEPKYP